MFLGASLGSRVAHRIDLRILRWLFVVVLLYTAVQMLLRAVVMTDFESTIGRLLIGLTYVATALLPIGVLLMVAGGISPLSGGPAAGPGSLPIDLAALTPSGLPVARAAGGHRDADQPCRGRRRRASHGRGTASMVGVALAHPGRARVRDRHALAAADTGWRRSEAPRYTRPTVQARASESRRQRRSRAE